MQNDPQDAGTQQKGSTDSRQKDGPGVIVTPTQQQKQRAAQQADANSNSDPEHKGTPGGQQAE